MKAKLFALVLATAALAIAGCGDDEEETTNGGGGAGTTETTAPETSAGGGGGGAGSKLSTKAEPSGALKFTDATLTAKAGKVTITMDNPSAVPHAVGIRGDGLDVKGETVGQGKQSTVTADLKPGVYEFYCPVPGHAEGGMKGPLTVE